MSEEAYENLKVNNVDWSFQETKFTRPHETHAYNMGYLLKDYRRFPQNLFSLTYLNPLIYNPFWMGMVLL